jgi:hypothetical protein
MQLSLMFVSVDESLPCLTPVANVIKLFTALRYDFS